jgi:dTDP-3-amino-3,4,6-trideoxy-alpha-D-glucose transaminase
MLLADIPVELVRTTPDAVSSCHLTVIRSSHRDHIQQQLLAEGITTLIHYPIPCHHQPALASSALPQLPVAEGAAHRVLSLPMGPHLTQEDVVQIVGGISRALSIVDVTHDPTSWWEKEAAT